MPVRGDRRPGPRLASVADSPGVLPCRGDSVIERNGPRPVVPEHNPPAGRTSSLRRRAGYDQQRSQPSRPEHDAHPTK